MLSGVEPGWSSQRDVAPYLAGANIAQTRENATDRNSGNGLIDRVFDAGAPNALLTTVVLITDGSWMSSVDQPRPRAPCIQ